MLKKRVDYKHTGTLYCNLCIPEINCINDLNTKKVLHNCKT
jgi:hypothetical protein